MKETLVVNYPSEIGRIRNGGQYAVFVGYDDRSGTCERKLVCADAAELERVLKTLGGPNTAALVR